MSGTDILPGTASARPETVGPGQFGERFGKSVTRARHVLAREYGTPSSQPTQDFDDEELLLELLLLRLDTDGATAIEVGGDIVRSAVGAPGKVTQSTKRRSVLQQCKHSH